MLQAQMLMRYWHCASRRRSRELRRMLSRRPKRRQQRCGRRHHWPLHPLLMFLRRPTAAPQPFCAHLRRCPAVHDAWDWAWGQTSFLQRRSCVRLQGDRQNAKHSSASQLCCQARNEPQTPCVWCRCGGQITRAHASALCFILRTCPEHQAQASAKRHRRNKCLTLQLSSRKMGI